MLQSFVRCPTQEPYSFVRENGYEGPKSPLFSETATYNIYLMTDLESAHFFDLEKLGLLLVIIRLGYGI